MEGDGPLTVNLVPVNSLQPKVVNQGCERLYTPQERGRESVGLGFGVWGLSFLRARRARFCEGRIQSSCKGVYLSCTSSSSASPAPRQRTQPQHPQRLCSPPPAHEQPPRHLASPRRMLQLGTEHWEAGKCSVGSWEEGLGSRERSVRSRERRMVPIAPSAWSEPSSE